MKIDAANISVESSYKSWFREQHSDRLDAWGGKRPPNAAASTQVTRIDISQTARARLNWDVTGAGPSVSTTPRVPGDEAMENDPFMSLVKSMIEMLTGEPVRIFSTTDLPPLPALPSLAAPSTAEAHPSEARSTGYGVSYDASQLREEFEQVQLAAKGVVRTSDGQEIRFTLDVQLERYYRAETQVSVRAGDAVPKDPLVLNFAGSAAQLTNQFFRFDLDGDGRVDMLPSLAAGNGFLAFDRNANGRIDDGMELFGPRTNSGFAELALLDKDGNGWIDENDPAFGQLSIWRPEGGMPESNTSLAASGVGALRLARMRTPFPLGATEHLGAMRESGLFIREDGRPGLLQEIDLNVM